jgi:hypothetical protein
MQRVHSAIQAHDLGKPSQCSYHLDICVLHAGILFLMHIHCMQFMIIHDTPHIAYSVLPQVDCLTFLVLCSVTSQVVAHSELQSVLTSKSPNFQKPSPIDGGEVSTKLIQSTTDLSVLDINPSDLKMDPFSLDEFLGKTFVHTLDDGTSYRATILPQIKDLDSENLASIKFLTELGDCKFNEIIAYRTQCVA